jgi:sigma-B regulation protein RsbU (phosphoserine phosphatase)
MRVLIADDDPVSRHLLLRTLEGFGYQVTVATDGIEAWKLFEERDYPLVVLDRAMPGIDGLEVIRRIRMHSRPGYTFILLLAAISERGEVYSGLEAGADEFMVKPLDPLELRARLRSGERVLKLDQALIERNRLLSDRNAQMEADLRVACEVQQALLPQGYPTFPAGMVPEKSRLRFFDRYRPNGAVGGDFFHVLALSDTRAGVLICDVMGHGVRAALGTAMMRGIMENHRPSAGQPARYLEEINRELLQILGQSSVPVYLSAFYGVMDTETGEFQFANAGHPGPLWVRRGDGLVRALPPPLGQASPPLGIRHGAMFPVDCVRAEPNDLFVFYTDGLIEGTNSDQVEFGEERLREAISRRSTQSGGRMFDEILAEVLRFTGKNGFADDVCMVGMDVKEVGGAAARRPSAEGPG